MIIMRETCPGRGWRRLYVAFIVCEGTGQLVVPGPEQALWERVI